MSLVRLLDTLALDSWVRKRNPFSIFGTSVAADAWLASDTSAFANTYIESRDTEAAYVFSAALPPGVKKEEVTVEVDEATNVLVITGERSVRREERVGDRWHHVERCCATFLGRFHLPEDAVVGGVRAAMDAGMLTVTVPKVGAAAAISADDDDNDAEKPAETPSPVAIEAGPACCSSTSSLFLDVVPMVNEP